MRNLLLTAKKAVETYGPRVGSAVLITYVVGAVILHTIRFT